MAASKSILVSALLRVAQIQGNPSGWLLGIIQGNYSSSVQGDGTVLISTSTGGSSGSFTLPAGMDPFSVIELAELALRTIGTGIDAAPTFNPDGSPATVSYISQLPYSQRTTSYAQFGSVRH